MRKSTPVRLGTGFVLAGVALGTFLAVVGVDRIRAELAAADPAFVAVGVASALIAVACWSEAQRRVLSATTGSFGGLRFRLAYLAGDFAKLVLPMGHVSGPAIMAYAIGTAFDVEYEDALAAITVSDLLNLLASVLLAALGVLVFLTVGRSPFLDAVGVALGVAVAGVLLLAALVFRGRTALTRFVVGTAASVHVLAVRVAPGRAGAIAPDRIRIVVRDYFGTLDAVASNRRAVGIAAILALSGWGWFTVPLYASALALDVHLPVALALFVVPVAGLATWIPVPGGLGGVEVAVAAALVGGAGLPVPQAAAVALLYRLCNYWVVVAVAGTATIVHLLAAPGYRTLDGRE